MTRIEFLKRKPVAGLSSQINLFPAPLLIFRWPEADDRKAGLLKAIDARRQKSRGLRISNVGGWHSERDFASWPDDDVQALVRWVAAMTSKATASWRGGDAGTPSVWRMMAWANVNPPGGARNHIHHHVTRNWNWSASYYVQVPQLAEEAEPRGAIVFEDRLVGLDPGGSTVAGPRTFRYEPTEGDLVMFPSWLLHRVEPHIGDIDRVSVAFNMHSPWLERSRYWRYRKGPFWRRVPWLMRPLARLAGKWDQTDPGGPPGADVTPDPKYL